MKKHFKKLFVLFLIVIFFGCATYKGMFDHNVIEDAIEGLAFVRTEGKVTRGNSKILIAYEIKAIAVHLDNGLILALTHATKTPSYKMFRTPFGWQPYPQKVLSEKWFVGKEEVHLVGRHEDISLFRSKSKKRFPFAFGDSGKVKPGTEVIVLGWSFGKAVNIKDGIISRINIGEEYGKNSENSFLITVPINPSDSGSPMLAYKSDGSGFEITGIVNAVMRDKGMGFAIKINYVKEAIKIILFKEGL